MEEISRLYQDDQQNNETYEKCETFNEENETFKMSFKEKNDILSHSITILESEIVEAQKSVHHISTSLNLKKSELFQYLSSLDCLKSMLRENERLGKILSGQIQALKLKKSKKLSGGGDNGENLALETEIKIKEKQMGELKAQSLENMDKIKDLDKLGAAANAEYEELKNEKNEMEERLGAIKQLLTRNLKELSKYTEKRENFRKNVAELKKFGSKFEIPVYDKENFNYYRGMSRENTNYINEIAEGRLAPTSNFWKEELKSLKINFDDTCNNLNLTPQNNTPLVKKIKRREKSRDFEHFETDSFYSPPQQQHGGHKIQMSENLKFPQKNKRSWKFRIFGKSRIAPTNFLHILKIKETPKKSQESKKSTLQTLLRKIHKYLTDGIEDFPKTLLINGIIYTFSERGGEPVRNYGPLNFNMWKNEELKKFKLFTRF